MIETHDDDRPEGPQFLSTQNTHTCYDKPYKVSLAHKTRPTNPRHTKKWWKITLPKLHVREIRYHHIAQCNGYVVNSLGNSNCYIFQMYLTMDAEISYWLEKVQKI